MMDAALPRDFQKGGECPHGALRRQCYTCDLEDEIARLKARVNETRDFLIEEAIHQAACDYKSPCSCGLDELIGEAE